MGMHLCKGVLQPLDEPQDGSFLIIASSREPNSVFLRYIAGPCAATRSLSCLAGHVSGLCVQLALAPQRPWQETCVLQRAFAQEHVPAYRSRYAAAR